MNKTKVGLICVVCNKRINKQRKIGNNVYCSRECWVNRKKIDRTKVCKHCNKTFEYRGDKNKKFCNVDCFNNYQSRNKKCYICNICGKEKCISKSLYDSRSHESKYCSIECRNKCEEWRRKTINGNIAQLNNKGLNKLELEGRKILNEIGFKEKLDFEEQKLMFGKFIPDVVFEKYKLVIQWDGVYWHTKERRIKLDKSQDAYFKKCGYKVLRFTDEYIKKERKNNYENIKRTISEITRRT